MVDLLGRLDDLSLEHDGERYRVYPQGTNWVLIKESMASEVLVKLCRISDGKEIAVEKARKYIGENE